MGDDGGMRVVCVGRNVLRCGSACTVFAASGVLCIGWLSGGVVYREKTLGRSADTPTLFKGKGGGI